MTRLYDPVPVMITQRRGLGPLVTRRRGLTTSRARAGRPRQLNHYGLPTVSDWDRRAIAARVRREARRAMTAQPGIAEKTAGPGIAGQAGPGTAAPGAAPRIAGRTLRRLYLPTLLVAGLAAWLSWLGWETLARYGPLHSIWAGQFELAGPAVTGFVLVVFAIEQFRPAQR